jgi:hypothetical protein
MQKFIETQMIQMTLFLDLSKFYNDASIYILQPVINIHISSTPDLRFNGQLFELNLR